MALMITDRCINCGYCVQECPNEAIYEPGMKWSMAEGTTLRGNIILHDGRRVNARDLLPPLSEEYYFIVPDKCAECKGIHEEPKCRAVCPDPDSIVVNSGYEEIGNNLLAKQCILNLPNLS